MRALISVVAVAAPAADWLRRAVPQFVGALALFALLAAGVAGIAGASRAEGAAGAAFYVVAEGTLYRIGETPGAVRALAAGSVPLAATPTGIWVAGPRGIAFQPEAPEGNATDAPAVGLGTPVAAAADPLSGDLWVATAELRVVRVARDGKPGPDLPLPEPAVSIAGSPDGSVWVLGEQQLHRMAPAGAALQQWALEGIGVSGAYLLHLDPRGGVAWVANRTTLVRIHEGDSASPTILRESGAPLVGLALDPGSKRLWVASADRLIAIDGETASLELDFGQLGVASPIDMAWAAAGRRLLLADETGIVSFEADSLVATRVLNRPGIEQILTPALHLDPVLDVADGSDAIAPGLEPGSTAPLAAIDATGRTRRAGIAVAPDGRAAAATTSVKAGGNKRPVVSLVSPLDGAVVVRPGGVTAWTLRLEAQASDPDGSVTKVEFRTGNTIIGTRTASPWTLDWLQPPAGLHALTAVATDNKGATSTSSTVQVRVNADPTLRIDSPVNNAILNGPLSITVAVTATDSDGTVSRVEVLGDGQPIASLTSAPYVATWSNAGVGNRSITVVATDNDGGSATSSVGVSVVPAPPPLVVLTSPAPCVMLDAPATLSLAADAVSPAGTIQRVEFYAGTTLLGSATAPPFTLTWANVAIGQHSLTARAYDSAGRSTTSTAASISIVAPNLPPHVALSAPAPGATVAVGVPVTIAANASDPDGTVSEVVFEIDSAFFRSVTAPPYSASWTPAAARNHVLSARAVDNRGASAVSSPLIVSAIANAAPQVALTAPADGTMLVAPATVVASASATDSDGSIARVEFLLDGQPVATASGAPYSASVTIAAPGSHTLAARAFDNLGGATTSTPITVIVNPNSAPQVSLTSPADGSRFWAPATISLAAAASDPDGSITRVDFYAGSTLLGSAAQLPYTFDWTQVAAGVYSLTAVGIDDAGASTRSAAVSVTVDPFSVSINSAVGGTGLYGDRALVTGAAQGPPGSAVTVNDVLAAVDATGTFYAEIPLSPGANTITAKVATLDGRSATATSSITSDGSTPSVRVLAQPQSGLVPLKVVYTVDNRSSGPVDVRFNDGAPLPVPADRTANFSVLHSTAGTYPSEVRITDAQGGSASRRFVIVARSYADADLELRSTYEGMLARLRAGDITGALVFISPGLRAEYEAMFDAIAQNLATAVEQLGTLESGPVGATIAEYALVRSVDGMSRIFFLYFIRGEDGLWRIGGM